MKNGQKWFKDHLQDGIVFVAGIIFAILVSEILEKRILYASTIFYFLLIGFLILIVYYVTQMGTDVRQMVISLGSRVRYVGSQWQTNSTRTGEVFQEVEKLIQSAESEILIVGHNDPYFDPDVTSENNNVDPAQEKRLSYLQSIELKLKQVVDRPFEYTRIIQLSHEQDLPMNEATLGPIEYNHCCNALRINHNQRAGRLIVNILKMQTERTMTFLIIDNRYLILADTAVKQTKVGNVSYVAGVFIIEDFNGSLIGDFRRYFLGYLVPSAQPLSLKDFTTIYHPTAL
jgi:hypothetical protein